MFQKEHRLAVAPAVPQGVGGAPFCDLSGCDEEGRGASEDLFERLKGASSAAAAP